jgi:hypothetical protein
MDNEPNLFEDYSTLLSIYTSKNFRKLGPILTKTVNNDIETFNK